MPITLDTVVVATPDQVSSDLEGEAVILHLGQSMYYGLNEVGARIWELIKQPTPARDVRDAIASEYDVDEARCERDVLNLLSELETRGLAQVVPADTSP